MRHASPAESCVKFPETAFSRVNGNFQFIIRLKMRMQNLAKNVTGVNVLLFLSFVPGEKLYLFLLRVLELPRSQ
jgi:hypothetical protein